MAIRAFRKICQAYRIRYPEAATIRSRNGTWNRPKPRLPARVRPTHDFVQESAESLFASGWRWHDPFGDCSYVLAASGLVMRAANARDLFHLNQSAPRILRPVSGDFVAEVVCLAADDRPAMGGLLLWHDKDNYLRVEWGRNGHCDLLFEGCVANVDAVYGPGASARRPSRYLAA